MGDGPTLEEPEPKGFNYGWGRRLRLWAARI